MSVETLLGRLTSVKQRGASRWSACCPAHDDKSPSLTISELPDGRVLIYCFALCGAAAVLDAVGLEFSALYPDEPLEHGRRGPHRIPVREVMEALTFEASIVIRAAAMTAKGETLPESDRERLALAGERILTAKQITHG